MQSVEKTSYKNGQVIYVPGENILPNPYQPRKNFNNDMLKSLSQSIRENGVLQPLLVRQISNSSYFELVAGERRLRASIMAGILSVPCIIVDVDYQGSALFSLLENLQRQDLDYFEEAESISQLISHFGLTQDEVAKRLGKSQSAISNKMRLLKLPVDIRYCIQQEGLTERHARALVRLPTEREMWMVLGLIKKRKLNVEQTEREVDRLTDKTVKHKQSIVKLFKDVRIFVNTINNAVDTMRSAGIDADSQKTETEEYIQFTVRIPKSAEKQADKLSLAE